MLADLHAALPPGVGAQEGPAAAPPPDYEDGYVLPHHYEKPLAALHSHPLDRALVFYEEPHVYTFHGVPTSVSVTGLAHEYEKPFVAEDAIAGMRTARSQAWPRVEYVVGATPDVETAGVWPAGRGALAVADGKTIAAVQPQALCAGVTRTEVRAVLEAVAIKGRGADLPHAEVYSFEREKTGTEISNEWSRRGRLASHLGTEAHFGAELFLNGLPCRWWEGEMGVLFDFLRRHMLPRGIVAYNTEKEIVCADADVAGSIDLIVWDARRGVHHIVDHKRSDKLRGSLRGYGKMAAPFSHLDDCKGAAYALQTSIYQYVLERDYGLTIGDRVLLSLHPDQPFCTSVPYLKAEVDYIMRRRFALVRARRAAAEAEERFRCALTGAPVVDAVRLADGRAAMEKAAQVQGLEATKDVPLRAAFASAVAARMEPVALDASACVGWRRLMPEGGRAPFE